MTDQPYARDEIERILDSEKCRADDYETDRCHRHDGLMPLAGDSCTRKRSDLLAIIRQLLDQTDQLNALVGTVAEQAQAERLREEVAILDKALNEAARELDDLRRAASHPGLIEWLLDGETGLSSETIVGHLLGIPYRHPSHPHDPADFRRCVKLLDAVPTLRPLLPRMTSASDVWAALIADWGRIEATLREEMERGGGRAPRTYELIKAAQIARIRETLHNHPQEDQ